MLSLRVFTFPYELFLMKYNHFTICWFLLYNDSNQVCVFIYDPSLVDLHLNSLPIQPL